MLLFSQYLIKHNYFELFQLHDKMKIPINTGLNITKEQSFYFYSSSQQAKDGLFHRLKQYCC
jgi:hypothetical protein